MKAAAYFSSRGWELLQQGDPDAAMRRLNQAWLLNAHDGSALWGMAAIESDRGESDEAMRLLTEAEPLVGDNLRFEIDHACMIAMAGTTRKDDALINDAYKRFQAIYNKAHENVINLQNWAITLFAVGKYPEAWSKIKLAEATPYKDALDPGFLAALQEKMPRPAK